MNANFARCAALLALAGVLSACGPGTAPTDGAAKPAAAKAEAAPSEPHPLPTVAYAAADLSGIAKAEGGQTVGELYANAAALAGKEIKVRGKVVKANPNIMDRTWIHLRDGTGEDGKNDLTITSSDPPPKLGATVLVTGTLSTGKDIGAGYKYDVLVENAKIVVE